MTGNGSNGNGKKQPKEAPALPDLYNKLLNGQSEIKVVNHRGSGVKQSDWVRAMLWEKNENWLRGLKPAS